MWDSLQLGTEQCEDKDKVSWLLCVDFTLSLDKGIACTLQS